LISLPYGNLPTLAPAARADRTLAFIPPTSRSNKGDSGVTNPTSAHMLGECFDHNPRCVFWDSIFFEQLDGLLLIGAEYWASHRGNWTCSL
jgi:hypothetical protein